MSSDIAERIKERLTAREVVEFYGFHIDRAGYIQCPFHTGDDHGSLKVYEGGKTGWHCFGCGAGGSVIDFVMRLFNLNFRQAVLRLNTDFNLGLTREKASKAERSAILEQRRREAARRAELEAEHADFGKHRGSTQELDKRRYQRYTSRKRAGTLVLFGQRMATGAGCGGCDGRPWRSR